VTGVSDSSAQLWIPQKSFLHIWSVFWWMICNLCFALC